MEYSKQCCGVGKMKKNFKIRSQMILLLIVSSIIAKWMMPKPVVANAMPILGKTIEQVQEKAINDLKFAMPKKSIIRNDIVALTSKKRSVEIAEHYSSVKARSTTSKNASVATTQLSSAESEWSYRLITAYNTVESQCDDTPCISANLINICQGLANGKKYVATNYLKFGSIIEIKDKYGKSLGLFEVVDRTNARYKYRIDIAFSKDQIQAALEFGKQTLLVRVVHEPAKDVYASAK
ncbi:MAG: hypothetical protein V1865_00785 [bacterium]